MTADPRATPAIAAAPLVAPGALRIEPVTRTAVTLLRAPADSAIRIAGMTGLLLPESREAVQGMGGAMTLRTGADSWLFLTAADAEPALVARLEKAFADRRRQIVDLGDAWAGVSIHGPAARAMLARALDGDTDIRGLAPGTHCAVGLAGAGIRLIVEAEHRFRLLVPRSAAAHVWSSLARAGNDHGLTTI